MNLMSKLEKLGLDSVGQRRGAVPPVGLQCALEDPGLQDGGVVTSADNDGTRPTGAKPNSAVLQTAASAGILTRNTSAPSNLGCVPGTDYTAEGVQLGSASQRSAANHGLNMIAHIGSPNYSGNPEVCPKLQLFHNPPAKEDFLACDNSSGRQCGLKDRFIIKCIKLTNAQQIG